MAVRIDDPKSDGVPVFIGGIINHPEVTPIAKTLIC